MPWTGLEYKLYYREMHITWHGEYTLKIVSGETTLILDPSSSFRAKATIVSLSNPLDSSMSNVAGIQGEAKILQHPGEYSLAGMTAHAMGWHDEKDRERTVQRWDIEKMVVLHLGALNRALTDEELSELERTAIDILFLPIDDATLPLKMALDILTKIEPRVVIPINFTSSKEFAQEMGVATTEAMPKYIAKDTKLPTEDLEVVILKP